MEHGTSSAYGKGCRCEVCTSAKKARDRDYYERNKEKIKAKSREWYEQNTDKGRESRKHWREANAEKLKEQKLEYYKAHAEEIKVRVREWEKANPERRAANSRRFREVHREERRIAALERYYRLMADDPERLRKLRRDWAKTQKGVLANRAARTARRGAKYTPEALEWIASLVDPMCFYCGRIATEIDHVVPISKGGTGERGNLVSSCRSCNARKNAMGLERFLALLDSEGRNPLRKE